MGGDVRYSPSVQPVRDGEDECLGCGKSQSQRKKAGDVSFAVRGEVSAYEGESEWDKSCAYKGQALGLVVCTHWGGREVSGGRGESRSVPARLVQRSAVGEGCAMGLFRVTYGWQLYPHPGRRAPVALPFPAGSCVLSGCSAMVSACISQSSPRSIPMANGIMTRPAKS